MTKDTHSNMHEGQDAFDRFRKAVRTIVSVPKSVVTKDRKKAETKRKHRKTKPDSAAL